MGFWDKLNELLGITPDPVGFGDLRAIESLPVPEPVTYTPPVDIAPAWDYMTAGYDVPAQYNVPEPVTFDAPTPWESSLVASMPDFSVDVPGFEPLSLPSESYVPERRAYNSALWQQELMANPGINPDDISTWTPAMQLAHAENEALGGGGLDVDYSRTGGYALPENVNPAFAEAFPTVSRLLGDVTEPARNLYENPWMERAGQSGSEIMTMVDVPDKATTGSKIGDLTADLAGGVMGFMGNPLSAGSTLWNAGETAARTALGRTALSRLPGMAQTGIASAAASVPFELSRMAVNEREFDPAELGMAIGSNALLDALTHGAVNFGKRKAKANDVVETVAAETADTVADDMLDAPKIDLPEVGAEVGRSTGSAVDFDVPEVSEARKMLDELRAMDEPVAGQDRIERELENIASGNDLEDVPLARRLEAVIDERIAEAKPKKQGVDIPIDERNFENVGNKKVTAFQFTHPEVKSHIQAEAQIMLGELQDTVKGQRFSTTNDMGERVTTGTSRLTSEPLERALDNTRASYAEIADALQRIIYDEGAENQALAKRLELIIDDNLTNGRKLLDGTYVPPNEAYIAEKGRILGQEVSAPEVGEIADDGLDAMMGEGGYAVGRGEAPEREGDYFGVGSIGAAKVQLPDTESTIASKTDRTPIEVKSMIRNIYQKTVDSLNRLNDVDKYVQKQTGRNLAVKDKMYIQAMNQKGSDQTARFIMEEGMVDAEGNIVGQSFKDVVQNVPKGKWRTFEDYCKLKNFLAWENDPELVKEVYPKDLNMNTTLANMKIAKLEAENPWIRQAQTDYVGWINQFGEKWLLDTGLISPEAWTAMRTKYQDYVPFQRVLTETELGGVSAKAGFANQPNPVKKAKGSERKTIESVETMLERIPAYVKSARRNAVMTKLIEHIQNDPEGMEPWGRIVTSDDAVLTMPDVVSGRVNGERVSVKVSDPQLLEALTKLSPDGQNKVIEFVRQGTRVMKMLTTGINPVFSLGRNIFRDLPTSYIASKSTNNPITWAYDLVGALVDIVGNKEMYQSYKAMGGGHSSSIAADRNLLAESKSRIMPGYYDAKKPVQTAWRGAKAVGGTLERLANVVETAPRLGEYRRNVRQGGGTYESKVKGLYEANDITTNFMRSGEISRSLDAIVPYLNASLQGLDKFTRMYKDNPVQAIGKSIAAITLPSIVFYAVNHNDENYQKLGNWIKDNNFCIPKGDGTFIKIPKPRESGVLFGALVERVMRQWQDNDPNAFENFAETVKTSFAPPARTIAAPFGDVRANKNFMGTPIIPGYMERLSPAQQYDETTSKASKWLGEKLNMAPKNIDYLIRSYTGVLGQLGIPAMSEGGNVKETLERQVTADPVYSNDVVSRFYDAKNELDTNYSDKKNQGDTLIGNDEKLRKLYSKVADTISETRAQMRDLEKDQSMDAETKKATLRGMQAAIVSMTEIVDKPIDEQMKLYNELKRKGKIEEAKPVSPVKQRQQEKKEEKNLREMTKLFTR